MKVKRDVQLEKWMSKNLEHCSSESVFFDLLMNTTLLWVLFFGVFLYHFLSKFH